MILNIADINSDSRFFLQNIPDIDYGSFEFVDIRVLVGGVVVFDERVFADASGHVFLRDIPSLLLPYISEPYMYVNFGAGSADCTVLYSRRFIGGLSEVSFREFVGHNFFCSAASSWAFVSDVFKIWFALLPYETDVPVRASVHFVKDGVHSSSLVDLGFVSNDDSGYFSIKSFSVDFGFLSGHVSADSVLTGVSFSVGDRVHKFLLSYKMPDLVFDFKNNFGFFERASFFGALKLSPSYNFVKANIRRVRFNVDVKETVNYSFISGALSVDDRTIVQDVFNTDVVAMVEDGVSFEVALNEQSLGWDKSGKVLSYASIEFERSANPGMAWVEAYDYRVFDDSFDYTFR